MSFSQFLRCPLRNGYKDKKQPGCDILRALHLFCFTRSET